MDSQFWLPLLQWLKTTVVTRGFLQQEELDLISVIDDTDELVDQISWCDRERCYESDLGVLRYPKRNNSNGPLDP